MEAVDEAVVHERSLNFSPIFFRVLHYNQMQYATGMARVGKIVRDDVAGNQAERASV
jgi:hypothetical protein